MSWRVFAPIGLIAMGLYAASFANPAADQLLRQRLRPLWLLFVLPATGLSLAVIMLSAAIWLFYSPAYQLLGPISRTGHLWLLLALQLFSLFGAIYLLARVFPRRRRWSPSPAAPSGQSIPLTVKLMKLFGAYTAFLLTLLLIHVFTPPDPSVAAESEPAAAGAGKYLSAIIFVLPLLALSLAVARARPTPLSYALGFVLPALMLFNFPTGTALGAVMIVAWRKPRVRDYFFAPPVPARRRAAPPGPSGG